MSITERSNLNADPKMYNDVESTLKQFASEINQKSLKIGQLICNGRFADIYKEFCSLVECRRKSQLKG